MLVLDLDQEEWDKGDYTSTSGNGISFTIYTEEKMVNVKNLSGYTLRIELYDQNNDRILRQDCDVLVAGSGTGEYLPPKGFFDINFIGEVKIELTGTNEVLTAVGTNGSAKLRIR
jgi:hypothetical protein